MHQGQQVAPDLALIGVAGEDLLRVTGIDRNLTLAGVVTRAREGTIETLLFARAVNVHRGATLGSGALQRRLGLDVIDAQVAGLIHTGGSGKKDGMVQWDPSHVQLRHALGSRWLP